MASAAAVAANQALSPEPDTLSKPDFISGNVTSAVIPPDEAVPDGLGDEDDDDDEGIVQNRRRGGKANGDMDEESENGDEDDLFGDVEEEVEAEPTRRLLNDEELDSGDDEGRADRVASEAPAEMETREDVVEYPDFGRQPLPEPSDGEMYLLKVPKFMSIEPTLFETPSFQAPTTDHHSRKEATPTFSAFNTAMSTVRWRKSPSNPKELQSNGRILRWSDGSLTLQLASDPTQQYEIAGKPLAPPQRNPIKPTPTSLKPGQKEAPTTDSFTYLGVPNESVGLIRLTHKITAGLNVLPSATTTDEALERLQSSLAAAVRGKNLNTDGGIEFVKIDEDPELARKKAEVAEREKGRAQKRREAAENRDRDRGNRALGRSGLSTQRYGAGGLTAGMLEDDEGGSARPRTKAKPRRQRRNSEYSDDEDFGRRRGNFGGDEYDVEDDFIAGSDEEEAVDDEDEDEDDGIVETDKSPKRSRENKAEASDEDADADADADAEEDVVQAPKAKRRRVIDEDDDED